MDSERTIRERVTSMLDARGRVEEYVGEQSDEGVQADLVNLRAAVGELQDIVIVLAEELDRRN